MNHEFHEHNARRALRSATVVLAEAVAVAAEARRTPWRTIRTRRRDVSRRLLASADANGCDAATCEQPYWSCSKRHPATAIRSSKS